MFLLIDKPKGITSHDVVDKVRKVTGEKKVGHAGTLDPNATGLLMIGVGKFPLGASKRARRPRKLREQNYAKKQEAAARNGHTSAPCIPPTVSATRLATYFWPQM